VTSCGPHLVVLNRSVHPDGLASIGEPWPEGAAGAWSPPPPRELALLDEIPLAYWREARRRAAAAEWSVACFLDETLAQEAQEGLPRWAGFLGYDVGARCWVGVGGDSLLWSENVEPCSARAAILRRRNPHGLLPDRADVVELLRAREQDRAAGADLETFLPGELRIYRVGLAVPDLMPDAPSPSTLRPAG